jgi:hypothetical protein
VKKGPAVEKWLEARSGHPLAPVMRRACDIIMGADPRMTEIVQHGTVQFVYERVFANFVQVADTKRVTLMFNVGASIPGRYSHLKGEGPNARFMRFADVKELNARAAELRKIAKAWCAMHAKTSKRD